MTLIVGELIGAVPGGKAESGGFRGEGEEEECCCSGLQHSIS